jgi:hypothetical protein
MWFAPVFEIGLWNAWIFILVFFISMFIPDILNAFKEAKGKRIFLFFHPWKRMKRWLMEYGG